MVPITLSYERQMGTNIFSDLTQLEVQLRKISKIRLNRKLDSSVIIFFNLFQASVAFHIKKFRLI